MLQSALEPYRSQINQNTVICFKTLWDTFLSNSYADLSHPFWNSFHPYLLHPYLNFEAVEYLNELKIGGIATDTPGLDCPLYDVVERFSKPALIQFKNEVFSGKAKIKLTANSHFRVVHHTFLSKKKCYIKNLHFPDIVDMESAPETTSKKDISKITRFLFSKQIEGMEVNIITEAGRLIILPIHARRTSLDAVLLKVFYIPENSMNDESR